MAWPPRFIFIGGSLAIDFVHTGGEGGRARYERWHSPSDLQDWAEASPDIGLRPATSEADVREAWRLREAIWAIASSRVEGRDYPREAWAEVEAFAARPDLVPVWRNGWRVYAQDADCSQMLSSVARDTLHLFGTPLVERFRKCASPTCGLMFVDHSRPGKRQWCTMARCGNMKKAARHRAKIKHKEGDDGHVH